MRNRRLQKRLRPASHPSIGHGGFTLTELLVVMTIIGIILTYILNASLNGVAQARQQATRSLIQKLDAAMSERMEALLSISVYPNAAHNWLATVWGKDQMGNPRRYESSDRAQVIAQFDFIKSEVPDIFFKNSDNNTKPDYPLNFAAQPYPGTLGVSSTGVSAPYSLSYGGYMLPLGAGILNDNASLSSLGAYDPTNPNGTGILGASYAAAAGIYKNLGYHPTGYDGVDNNQNGLIDESAEGVDANNSALVTSNLEKHTHKTARSEMLYAILVEGMGPLGSVFAPDDFTSKEVADTDGDGLPEFIDAWGEPLQFYRWPIFYHSDMQRGFPNAAANALGPYASLLDNREQDPLDSNQQLISPSWLLTGQNITDTGFKKFFNSDPNTALSGFGTAGDTRLSTAAWAFQTYFHTLVEPMSLLKDEPAASLGTFWDRTVNNAFADYRLRRGYFAKFLILSSGPDLVPGVAQLGFDYRLTGSVSDGSGAPVAITAAHILQIENTAAAIDPNPNQWNTATGLPSINPNTLSSQDPVANGTTLYLQQDAGLDDISNHSGQAAAGSNP